MPRFPRVSPTTGALTEYVFTALRKRIAEHRGPLYRLHIGDTWLEPLPEARAESLRTADLPGLHTYAPVQGMPELLDAIQARIQRRTGLEIAREDLQVVAGATAGLSIVCQALLDPGDEVLLPSPYWPLIGGIIASRGAVPVEIPFYDRLDAVEVEATLEAAITPRTVAIYLNSPNNPTGRLLEGEDAAAVARVAERHGLWVFSDEVYEDLWYTDSPPAPLWTRPDLRDRTVAVHSLSKAYGLAGARIGYVHGPTEAMRAVRAVQTFQTYCAARPMQVSAARALAGGDAWLSEARSLYREAALRTSRALGLALPSGGTFLFFDASPWLAGGRDAFPFLERCLDAGVVLTPGAASGRGYESWVRVCFTTVPLDDLDRALERLSEILGRRPS